MRLISAGVQPQSPLLARVAVELVDLGFVDLVADELVASAKGDAELDAFDVAVEAARLRRPR